MPHITLNNEFYVLVREGDGGLKSPYKQSSTVVLYSDIGTAKRNRGSKYKVAKVSLIEDTNEYL